MRTEVCLTEGASFTSCQCSTFLLNLIPFFKSTTLKIELVSCKFSVIMELFALVVLEILSTILVETKVTNKEIFHS